MRILNWNTQIATPRGVNWRFETIKVVIALREADIICLTEAYPETMPSGGYIVTSGLSGWERHERLGARRVVLWSRNPWTDVDDFGSARLPEGRFVRAVTQVYGKAVTVVGMCIPFHNYRYHDSWGEKKLAIWQGAIEYLDALREDILPQARYQERTMLIGDYRLQIPPRTYPYPSMVVNKKREETFTGWSIPTAVDYRAVGLDKPMVDHIALTSDFRVRYMDFISRFSTDILSLSDHNGVCIGVDLP
ncbi:MAG: hypothetical protein OXG60_07340 [Chloroflexi bacterium]|nr:hypothetical protein [Chloroflexota bacterium]